MKDRLFASITGILTGFVLAFVFFVTSPVEQMTAHAAALPQRPANAQLTYQSDRVSTGAEAEITISVTNSDGLTQTWSPACSFHNIDATDSINLEFNDSAAEIFLGPGATFNTSDAVAPLIVFEFRHEAEANSPDFDYVCVTK